MTDPAPVPSSFGFRREGLFFNLICGAYFLLVSPHVVAAVKAGAHPDPTSPGASPWLGALLALVMILEIYSLPEKLKFVHFAIRERREGDASSVGLFFLWMFHTVISILVLFHAANAFGANVFDREKGSEMPGWLGVLVFLVVIKELYLLFPIWLSDGANLPAERYARPKRREWFHDLVLVSYACLAYSLTWGIMADTPLQREHPVMWVVNTLVASLLFLIFYLPMRIPYQVEEWAGIKTGGDLLRWVLSILAALVPAIWALP